MIKVYAISEVENYELIDLKNIKRRIRLYEKNGNLYIGPIHSLFNRNFVFKDKCRLDFVSKLDNHFNELLHVQSAFKKIEQQSNYSNFTIDMLKDFLKSKGYKEEDFSLKEKTYTCAKENFIDFGFNSMNFCLDKKGDIWVHYKEYEEQKQYREIINQLNSQSLKDFEKEYRKMHRFIRYVNMEDVNDIKCFALKSINVSKLYAWLTENKLIHKVKYITDIYNDAMRELSFTDITPENSYVKVVVTEDGIMLKSTPSSIV